jgi:L-lactate dehydrogenase complex protein LldF
MTGETSSGEASIAPGANAASRQGMIHPDLLTDHREGAVGQDGRPLDHAEATSRPMRPKIREPQPRGARIRGSSPIDQSEAATRFIAATEHEKMHDERLWDLRKKRDRVMHGIEEWEELREIASQIKQHTLAHLDQYLEQFEAAAMANGVTVHWAADGAEHNRIVHGILRDHGAKTLIKSKSMLTEECGMRSYMASVGIEVIETDLGERIQQLDNEDPSHVVVPAVHKLRGDVAEVFAREFGTDPNNDDVHYLAEQQRQATRPLILGADAGMTGANFAVAETGSFVVCTNEGNADLSANVPPLHIASIGIEKIIPCIEHLGVFVRLLSRSALGSPMTQYTSHFRAPRRGGEMHIVLVDNGRTARLGMAEFWTSLKCIRCGACMNTCPVYRRSGGLSYGATYSGPIGLILDPTFDRRKYSALPFSSSLNGSCSNVCPVKINIHEQIFAWRKVMSETHEIPLVKTAMMKAAGELLSHPALYRVAITAADSALRHLPKFLIYNPMNTWTLGREMPEAPRQTFHSWWKKHRMEGKADAAPQNGGRA